MAANVHKHRELGWNGLEVRKAEGEMEKDEAEMKKGKGKD